MSNLKNRLMAKDAAGQAPAAATETDPTTDVKVTTVIEAAPENVGTAGEVTPSEGHQPFTAGTAPGYEPTSGVRVTHVGDIKVTSL